MFVTSTQKKMDLVKYQTEFNELDRIQILNQNILKSVDGIKHGCR